MIVSINNAWVFSEKSIKILYLISESIAVWNALFDIYAPVGSFPFFHINKYINYTEFWQKIQEERAERRRQEEEERKRKEEEQRLKEEEEVKKRQEEEEKMEQERKEAEARNLDETLAMVAEGEGSEENPVLLEVMDTPSVY